MSFLKLPVKKLYIWLVGALNSLHQKSVSYLIYNVKSVKHKDVEMKFLAPNWINRYRIRTFSTKEPETLLWIEKMPQGSVFWDIGANVGLYSIFAAKRKCQVLSFEPSVFNLEWLARNIDVNQLQNSISIAPFALSNKSGSNLFKMKNTDWGGALSTFGESYDQNGFEFSPIFQYSITGVTVDLVSSLVNTTSPDYIKIDVDGIEHLVLEGAKETLLKVKSLLIEIDDSFLDQADLCSQYLSEAGLTLKEKHHLAENQYNQLWVR